MAIGLDTFGKRSVPGAIISLSEAKFYWREFLAGLYARGLHWVRLVVGDAHAGTGRLLESNVPEGLTVLDRPSGQRRRLRTSSMLEWLDEEIDRRL